MAVAGKRSRWLSTVIAGLLVLAAGLVVWQMSGGRSADPVPASAVTAPVADQQAEQAPAQTSLEGALPTRVVVASAGVDAPVSEVWVTSDGGRAVWETAWRAAGHHVDSARPGQPGNMVLTGHVSVADPRNLAVFSTLDRARPGDLIEVYAGDQVYRYVVRSVAVVSPTSVRILRSDHTATVTLITCTRDLKNRLVVVGALA